jgi:hypothetical protein
VATEPTRLVLDGKAEYIEDGDTVLVAVYVVDPDLEMGFPGHVRSGFCALLYKNQEVRRIEFDRRFGNGEGAQGDFVFQFLHPPFNRDMKIKLEVEAPISGGQGSGILRKTIPVVRADTPFIPMQPQLDTGSNANGELRSKKRMEEEV